MIVATLLRGLGACVAPRLGKVFPVTRARNPPLAPLPGLNPAGNDPRYDLPPDGLRGIPQLTGEFGNRHISVSCHGYTSSYPTIRCIVGLCNNSDSRDSKMNDDVIDVKMTRPMVSALLIALKQVDIERYPPSLRTEL